MDPLGLLYVYDAHGTLWFVQRFYGMRQWKVTPMGMGKIHLEQDVSFGI